MAIPLGVTSVATSAPGSLKPHAIAPQARSEMMAAINALVAGRLKKERSFNVSTPAA